MANDMKPRSRSRAIYENHTPVIREEACEVAYSFASNDNQPQSEDNSRYDFNSTDCYNETWTRPTERQRSQTTAPQLPPKQSRKAKSTNNSTKFGKSLSLEVAQPLNVPTNNDGDTYLSYDEIASFPDNNMQRRQTSHARMQNYTNVKPRPSPPITGIKVRKKETPSSRGQNYSPNLYTSKQSSSPTKSNLNSAIGTVNAIEVGNYQAVSLPGDEELPAIGRRSPEFSIKESSNNQDDFDFSGETIQTELRHVRSSSGPAEYSGLQKRAANFVMDFNKIQSKLTKLYRKIEDTPSNSIVVSDLKMHLRLSDHDSTSTILKRIHESLAPKGGDGDTQMYVVNFCQFDDKQHLRQQIINMFAKPGPPSISYSKVDAKMDNLITKFCTRVEELRNTRNDLVESPAHARMILHDVSDGEGLIKVLRDNQLWIRWGTTSNLPPLSHLYMHKIPPSYEVRKAVTISYIAERQRALPHMFESILNPYILCPPIYSRLRTENANQQKWQVTEYNQSTCKFEEHECKFPSWLEDQGIISLLKSSNRSSFELGEHPYSLYAVYLVVIKDFTLLWEDSVQTQEKESSWATPSNYQCYVGSSSTGVLYRFIHVKNSHCDRTLTVLREASGLSHFRCYDGCDLVETCLALSWARRQPRAVFVLNSFLARNMSSMSLERKRPFKEKMLALESHLMEGRKLGSLSDMRYGMNGTTTITDEENK